ncbi:MAG: hypothetical protein L0Z51_13315 [Candidatus Latescibacteria bacterium]|nr:hypothetical protein [Candidatus Latescibacterota bacterium]
MKKTAIMILAAIGLVALSVPGCLEDKVLEIVFTGETFADFSENEDGADEAETAFIDVADEIRKILEDNELTLDDIDDAFVTSVHYGVTSFGQSHDWVVSGTISVRRVDLGGTSTVIVNYTSQSVQAALGQKIAAPLEAGGVAVVNTALDDFRAGANPVLEFEVLHGTISPVPTPADPMIFDWRAWLAIQIVTTTEVEVPDPF